MREIKFRAYIKKYSEVDKVTVIDWEGDKTYPEGWICTEDKRGNDEGTDFDCVFSLKDVELMEWTGLKDRDGVDIYEGDILSDGMEGVDGFENEYCVVKWYQPYVMYSAFVGNKPYALGEKKAIIDGKLKKTKVIGNVYENPELLNKYE